MKEVYTLHVVARLIEKKKLKKRVSFSAGNTKSIYFYLMEKTSKKSKVKSI